MKKTLSLLTRTLHEQVSCELEIRQSDWTPGRGERLFREVVLFRRASMSPATCFEEKRCEFAKRFRPAACAHALFGLAGSVIFVSMEAIR